MIIKSKVPSNYKGQTVVEYLTQRFTYLTQTLWEERILEKRISVNDTIKTSKFILSVDDIVAYDMPNYVEEPADLNYKIVYEDEYVMAVDKPGNLLVHYNKRNFKSNLIYQLRYENRPLYPDSDIINRLDRETSGLVLVSKCKDVLKKMNALFVDRKVEKKYIAIVHGLAPKSGVIKDPIGKNDESLIKSKHIINGVNAKGSLTKFSRLECYGEKFSLLELIPQTGRTHQLRVHLLAIDHPIVGDKFYTLTDTEFFEMVNEKKDYSNKLLMERLALHCIELSFIHPFTDKPITIKTDIPPDMFDFIKTIKN